MLMAPVIDGPPWGCCSCGWPLLPDGSCSNGDCVDMGLDDDLDDMVDACIDVINKRAKVIEKEAKRD